ncbi:hypothetical protein [Pseudochrobactrum sp. XF203]|uniref:hypothetical protein n=1 Tax=Pseudochrobactrum sp. XF203 TaxID=2879116 RepID=UPI001CE31364|nr:hypothetical protein [Pseudochrobactrum sp. XF203]UCA47035.1 hypothetical protein LDL70_07495 [Pseudochrobactrum sp. XF203]
MSESNFTEQTETFKASKNFKVEKFDKCKIEKFEIPAGTYTGYSRRYSVVDDNNNVSILPPEFTIHFSKEDCKKIPSLNGKENIEFDVAAPLSTGELELVGFIET